METQPHATRTKSIDEMVAETSERSDFYQRAAELELTPLWTVISNLVKTEPSPKAIPHRWKYEAVRPFLMEACSLVSAAEAERRVLTLQNPGLRGQSRVAENLFCGFQVINAGEIAPAHRHTQAALRFIVEGSNAYTAVDGERTMMTPGDFVITPTWTWHDHKNIGNGPMVWVDGLDTPIINTLNGGFREELDEQQHPITKPDDSSSIEFGYAMAPADFQPNRPGTPIINYPYRRARKMLETMRAHRPIDPCCGHMLKYLNPLNGDWAIPTLATNMRLLPKGMTTESYRTTATTVFVVVEGEGVSRIGGVEMDWHEHDVMIAPAWTTQEFEAHRDSIIFSYSDRAVQEKLHIWREMRGIPS
jgi:gentisate 1,2-dioxygenase